MNRDVGGILVGTAWSLIALALLGGGLGRAGAGEVPATGGGPATLGAAGSVPEGKSPEGTSHDAASPATSAGAWHDGRVDPAFPASTIVVDVSKPPYNAKGDGVTDDTAALQSAINDHVGGHRIIYLPPGTYLVSDTLRYTHRRTDGGSAWGFTTLHGAGSTGPRATTIRLKDSTFTDPASPKPIVWGGGFGSADWFHNYTRGITFDVGRNNPGAIGLHFYSNNSGAIRDVRIVSQDGKGRIGLDLSSNMNGPLLVQDVTVEGFEVGIHTGAAVNSQTFEHVTLRGQSQFGLDNAGQAITIRGLLSENSVIAVRTYGMLWLMDCVLSGRGESAKVPAIVNYNGGRIGMRDVTTTGYGRAIGDVETPDWVAALRITGSDKPGTVGPNVPEYFSHGVTSPFGGPATSLRLPIRETPTVPLDDPGTWAVAETFGADPTSHRDSAAAIQRAIDSGATTVFLPGQYILESPLRLRGNVRRLVGSGGMVDYVGKVKPSLIVEDGKADVVMIEHFGGIGGGVTVDTARTVVLKSVMAPIELRRAGDVFLEDVATGAIRINRGQHVWARQLNIENEGTHLLNEGGTAWVLGYKTERGGTLLASEPGAKSEIFGTFSYTTTAGKLAPMFTTTDAAVFAYFREICYNGDPFTTLIRETRNGTTKTIKPAEAGPAGGTMPYVSHPGPK